MDNKKFNFIITNFITLLRVIGIFALIPIFKKYGGFATFLLCSVTFLTDCIDGIMARSLKSSTFFGSLFDAASDKAFLIINLFLLMKISPLAIVLVLFELGIAYVQSVKYNKGMNIQSNVYGKAKMWVAGIVISLSYLIEDQSFLNYLGIHKLTESWSLKLFGLLFTPLVISEILTLGSYTKEYFVENKKLTKEEIIKREKENKRLEKEINNISFKEILFEHTYYEKYKDYGNLKLISTLSKKSKVPR